MENNMNAMQMETAMIERDAVQKVAIMLGRDLIAYKNKEHKGFDIGEWGWDGVEYDQGDKHVQVWIERYYCGELDREYISIPFEWFDMKREEIYAIIDKEQEEKQRKEKERVETMKKQMDEEAERGKRALYESLKKEYGDG